MTSRCMRSSGMPGRRRHDRLDRVGVRHRDDRLAGVLGHEVEHRVHGPDRHLGEGLAAGEAEPAGPALDLGPLLGLGTAAPAASRSSRRRRPRSVRARCAPAGRGRGRSGPPSPGCARGATRRRPSGPWPSAAMRSATTAAWARPFSARCRPGALARQHLAGGRGRAVADEEDDGRRRSLAAAAVAAGGERWSGRLADTSAHRRLCAVASNRGPRDSLAAVQRDVAACRRCPRLVALARGGGRTGRASYAGQTYWGRGVPGFGDPGASLVIVGLAPAAHGANRTGRMFTGDRSGDWLFAALYRAGFASQPTSTVARRRPRAHRRLHHRRRCTARRPANKPDPTERAACAPYLARELALLDRAAVVVALGQFAWQARGGPATACVRARPSATWPRPAARRAARCSARTTRASRTPSPAS